MVYLFFLIYLKGELELGYKMYVVGNSYYCYYVTICFILCELETTSPLGWHLPHLVDNTYTLYLGDQHWQQTVLVFFRCLLFNANQVGYGSINLYIWPFSQKLIKTQWLASGKWCCPLVKDRNWSWNSQIADKKLLNR